jgi:hypothetical protein
MVSNLFSMLFISATFRTFNKLGKRRHKAALIRISTKTIWHIRAVFSFLFRVTCAGFVGQKEEKMPSFDSQKMATLTCTNFATV